MTTFTQIQESEQELIDGGFNGEEFAAGAFMMGLGAAGEYFFPALTPVNIDFLTSGSATACKGCYD